VDEHRVAVAVEAVGGPYGIRVGAEDGLPAREGGDQEEEGGFRKVEVCHQGVDGLKGVPGANHEIGLAGPRGQTAISHDALQGAHGGGADRDHAVAGLSSLRIGGRGFFRHEDRLRRDAVVTDILHVNPGERAWTHVEHDFVNRDPPLPDLLEQLRGEVKARGGSGDAARLAGVDGLVPFAIERPIGAIDVGRERKVSYPEEEIEDPGSAFEFHGASAIRVYRDHPTLFLVPQGHDRAHFQFATGPDKGSERVVAVRLREEIEHFGAAAAAGVAEKTGGQNFASIHDHEIALAKEVGQGREPSVFDGAAASVEGQEPRSVPVLERRLRDQLRRQVEVEVLRLQKSFFCGRSASGRSRPKCL